MDLDALPPNHHARHPPFRGVRGLLAALSMTVGRSGDAAVARSLAGMGTGDRVVDVGCGPGVAVRAASAAGASAVVGVDPSAVMRRVARLLGVPPGGTYADGVAEALPVEDGWATVVWSIATAHHWGDVDAGLAEAGRVLQPGGRVVVLERRVRPGATGLASHGWSSAQAAAFAERCMACGFTDVVVGEHDTGRRGPALAVVGTRR